MSTIPMLSAAIGLITLSFLVVTAICALKIAKIAKGAIAWKFIALGCVVTGAHGFAHLITMALGFPYRYSVMPASVVWFIGCILLAYGLYRFRNVLRLTGGR